MTTFKYGGNILPQDNFFIGGNNTKRRDYAGHYEGWRHARITKLISILGGENYFKGKRVLELACGFGHTGEILAGLGAEVVFAEGRELHVLHTSKFHSPQGNGVIRLNQNEKWDLSQPVGYDQYVRYGKTLGVSTMEAWPGSIEKATFDLIIHWGVLYHLEYWQQDLECALQHTDLMCLESEIADSIDDTYDTKVSESWPDGAIPGSASGTGAYGSRPSAAHVEKVLRELGCTFVRYDDADLNFRYHKYDWEVQNTGTAPPGQRRFWLVRK